MGCWNETCMITQLPITSNEDVILLILKKLRYKNVPCSFAIKGKYNDYGQLEENSIELPEEHLKILKKQNDFSGYDNIYEIIKDIEREEFEHYSLAFINKSVFEGMIKHINDNSPYNSTRLENDISELIEKEIITLHPELGIVYFENHSEESFFLEEVRPVDTVLYEMRETVFIELFKNKNKNIIPLISELVIFHHAMNRARKIYLSYNDYTGSQNEYYGVHSVINEAVNKHINYKLEEHKNSNMYDEDSEFLYMFDK